MSEIEPQFLDKTHKCPACDSDIDVIADVQNPQPFKKGNFVVCATCATILKVGDSSLVKVSKEEFKALDKQSRFIVGNLVMTILGRNVGQKFKSEGRFH